MRQIRYRKHVKRLGVAVILLLSWFTASSQALPAATRAVQLSVFALTGDVYTGLGGFGMHEGLGGRNIPLTVGVDVGFRGAGAYRLAAEVRGTYPLYSGHVDGQESILGGLRVQRDFSNHPLLSRLHIYGDLLGGRGTMLYVDGGYGAGGVIYTRTPNNVFGGGGGFEIDCSYHWAVVGEAQLQHWDTPVIKEGSIYSKSGTAGLVYRF